LRAEGGGERDGWKDRTAGKEGREGGGREGVRRRTEGWEEGRRGKWRISRIGTVY
jgi:hypothetical protein